MIKRIVIALEQIAASLKNIDESMRQILDGQQKAIASSQEQAQKTPAMIAQMTEMLTKSLIPGGKNGN